MRKAQDDCDSRGGDSMADERVIRLDQFLKLQGLVMSGGEAKHIIQGGLVRVNGTVDTRRSLKLRAGDVVELGDSVLTVAFE